MQFFVIGYLIQGFLPISFNNIWINNATRHQDLVLQLRNYQAIYVPPARLKTTENHPYHSFPRSWAAFDNHDIKLQREKVLFNSKLKKYFCDLLSDTPRCNRLLCPSCHLSNLNNHSNSNNLSTLNLGPVPGPTPNNHAAE